jgi:RimJ/RimL family protein N-acetyltransferase
MKGAPPNRHYLAPDIGYAILPEMNGRGYATEAAKGLLEWARVELGITDVFGFCDTKNLHSRRVLEKIGMEFKGFAALEVFGGANSAVCTLPGMSEDLSVYGLTEDIRKEN